VGGGGGGEAAALWEEEEEVARRVQPGGGGGGMREEEAAPVCGGKTGKGGRGWGGGRSDIYMIFSLNLNRPIARSTVHDNWGDDRPNISYWAAAEWWLGLFVVRKNKGARQMLFFAVCFRWGAQQHTCLSCVLEGRTIMFLFAVRRHTKKYFFRNYT
jgi:hypothetical protein